MGISRLQAEMLMESRVSRKGKQMHDGKVEAKMLRKDLEGCARFA
jgi:hypothetical protein